MKTSGSLVSDLLGILLLLCGAFVVSLPAMADEPPLPNAIGNPVPAATNGQQTAPDKHPPLPSKKSPPKFLQGIDKFMKAKVEPALKKTLGESSGTKDEDASAVPPTGAPAKAETGNKPFRKVFKTITNTASSLRKVPVLGQQLDRVLPPEFHQALQVVEAINQWQQIVKAAYGEEPVREAHPYVIEVEETDAKGETIRNAQGAPVLVEFEAEDVRELRDISSDQYREKTHEILRSDEGRKLMGAGDKEAEPTPSGERINNWCTQHNGDAAQQLARELMALVALKGGTWHQPEEGRVVLNAVAIRGRDFDKGLRQNEHKTYDDTLFIVKNAPVDNKIATVVREYRMTTESSSEVKGVGRLASKQFTYLEGIHKGQYPAYCMKGGAGEGTRNGQTGKATILGANIHSSMRLDGNSVTSIFPLPDNMSLGCQVIACSQPQFESDVLTFVRPGKEFPYTIAESSEAQMIVEELKTAEHTSHLTGSSTDTPRASL